MPFPWLPERVAEIRSTIATALGKGGRGQSVEIVAVTKTFGPDAVQAAWEAGLRHVGENRVQEAAEKMEQVTAPVSWHLIGHLQRNKVKQLDRFALFHALDSLRLAEAIHERGEALGRRFRVLVQVNTSGEDTKGGFSLADLPGAAARMRVMEGLEVAGAMTMAPYEADEATLRRTFGGCRESLRLLQDGGLPATELSMGMSGDYVVAVEEGATLVRLGTILFGARAP